MQTESAQRAAVVAEARRWLGTPYHHMGRVLGAGVDCATLPAEIYAACGVMSCLNVAFYPQDWHLHRGDERYLAVVTAIAGEVANPLPGDFVLWRFGRCLAHGAIVIDWPVIIHALNPVGVVLDDGESAGLNQIGLNKIRERRIFSPWRRQT